MSENKNKTFLRPLSVAIATVLATTSSVGAFSGIVSQAAEKSKQVISGQITNLQEQLVLDSSDFKSNASKMAYHYSHQSHSSHMSHQSHSSHYSSRY